MTDVFSPPLESTSPDDGFCAQTQQILEHLYDFPFLQHNPVARWWEFSTHATGETAGQRLRREVMTAIESLSPEPGTPFRASSARLYNVLQLRYVEGHTVLEVAHMLSISPRQAHRDLRQAEQSVAEVLWARAAAIRRVGECDLSTVQSDIDRVGSNIRVVDARSLLQRALLAVDRLARSKYVTLEMVPSSQSFRVATDVPAAQQLLVSLLSHVVKQALPGAAILTLGADDDSVILDINHASPSPSSDEVIQTLDPVVHQLMARLEWRLSVRPGRPSAAAGTDSCTCAIRLRIPSRRRIVLIIDDNEGLVAMLERFLLAHSFSIVKASTGSEGLRIAREVKPDAVVLDVLLPSMDGWEVLQSLQNDPSTISTPVIIFSVFNEPELAYSLGASKLLCKPVSREDLLLALRELELA